VRPAGRQRLRRRPLLEILLLARSSWVRLTLAAVAGAGAMSSAVALTATSAWLLSRAAQHPPVLTLMVAIVAVRAFGLARGVLRYAERLAAHDAAFRILAGLRVRIFTALEPLAPSGLAGYRSGDLLACLVDDVDALQDLYLRVSVPVAAGTFVGVLSTVGVGFASPAAGLALLLGLGLVGVLLPWWSARAGEQAEAATTGLRTELTVAVLDAVDGAPDLIAYGADRRQLDRVGALDGALLRASRVKANVAGWSAGLSSLVSGATTWSCLVLGIAAVRSGQLSGVMLALVVLTPMAAFEAVTSFPGAAQQLGRLRDSARRVLEVLDLQPAGFARRQPIPGPAGGLHLRLDDVDVTWPGAEEPALRRVTLDLPPGKLVAVVGPSGAGKSTLAALLLAFLEPSRGRLLVNGVDGRLLDPDDVRRRVGLCGQDAHIFDATIEDNVRIGKADADEPELREALRAARLLAWVDSLPLKLATPVGEHGRQLSGGQRQRLALARALIADRPVMVLDEPVEHVEDERAAQLMRDLLRATSGRTTIVVTHRLDGLEDVDEILVLDRGRVIERGTHKQLVSRDGWYAGAWHRQLSDVRV
jgi:thiol reductant ABC exporter CydC subunit